MNVHYAKAYPGMRINCVDPGHTVTDFKRGNGNHSGEQGAEDSPTGAYFNRAGRQPW
jgi:hypothetical protein